jgi:hypothetical protein
MMKTTARLGFRSAIAFAALFALFNIAFILMIANLPLRGSWWNVRSYAASWNIYVFLPEMIGLVMLPVFMMLAICIHALATDETRPWSTLGLAFAGMFVFLVLTLYFLQVGFVLPNLIRGELDSVSMWAFANPYGGVAWGLNFFGWALFGAALFFLAFNYRGSRLDTWIRWLLIANGIGNFSAVFGYALDDSILQAGAVISWLVLIVPATILIALKFERTA